MAEFFAHAADLVELHGASFGHEHFCDFAGVPGKQQRLADIIVASGKYADLAQDASGDAPER